VTPAIRPQPHEASDSPPAPSAAHPGAQIAAGVAGSVAVTLAAKTLGGSPWATLAVALVGATIPVLISYTPRHRHLRLGLVLIVVLVAFALTYGGFSLYDAAADRQTFPRPGPTPTPTASATATPDGGARARVTPPSLTCTPEQCGQVEIANVGGTPLDVGEIRFADGEADGFTRGDACVGRTIARGDGCTFAVGFAPPFDAGTRSATLLVPTSDGRVASVQLQGTGGEPADFAFDGQPTCARNGTAATLSFALTGPAGTSPSVDTDFSEPSPRPVGTPIDDYVVELGTADPVTVTLVVNADDAIPELPQDDNTAQAQC
jgi:hypothetical protein